MLAILPLCPKGRSRELVQVKSELYHACLAALYTIFFALEKFYWEISLENL